MSLAPNDKRRWHGALAVHSPYAARTVFCVTCSTPITNTAEQARLGQIRQRCRDRGWQEPREFPA